MKKALLFLFMLLTYLSFAQTKEPNFKDYPVNEIFNNESAKLTSATINELRNIILGNSDTVLNYVNNKANFAGHYEIVEWGCGSPCGQAVILNCETGKIIGNISFCFELHYNLNSYLIKVDDIEDNNLCLTSYLLLKNNKIIDLK